MLVADDPAVMKATTMNDYHLRDGGTGTRVIAALRSALDRPIRAVLITGDTSSAVKELRDPSVVIVSKPVNADELLAMLPRLMDS
jgi:ActR/RegA family two-component response regulator